MKNICALVLCAPIVIAQTSFDSASPGDTPTVQEVKMVQGSDQLTHRRISGRLEHGEKVYSTNQWTILQPGIGYWDSEQNTWKATSDEIELAETGAIYRKGPFNLKFPADYTASPLEFTLPDKRVVKIQTVGFAVTDQASGDSLWLGEPKSAAGFLDGNTVIYSDAFSGIKADIVVKVGIGRWESDVVLREQTVSPQALGWQPESTRLEIWHEVVEMPQGEPVVTSIMRTDGTTDSDTQLTFNNTLLGPGTAFLVGTNKAILSTPDGGIPVAKEWFTDPDNQKTYLIEKVPYSEAASHLQALPARQEALLDLDKVKDKLTSNRRTLASAKRAKPISIASLRREHNPSSERKVAAITRGSFPKTAGFVMDYTWLQTATNFCFEGSKTYYVTNSIDLTGTTTLEPGTVVKFPPFNGASTVNIHGKLNCLTTPSAPAVFTADADNSVGEVISTNALSGYYGRYNIGFTAGNTSVQNVHDIRTGYAYWGIVISSLGTNIHNFSSIQFENCFYGIQAVDWTTNTCYISAQNILGENTVSLLYGKRVSYVVEHLTAHKCGRVFQVVTDSVGTLNLINSLLVSITNTSSPGVTETKVATLASDAGVFQTALAGGHYLAATNYRNWGTNAVSDRMKAILRSTTTFPPTLLTNAINSDTILAPRIKGDNENSPDVGYHYTLIDYYGSSIVVSNATLTLTNGVSVAAYGPGLFILRGTGAIVSHGRPNRLNRLITYNSVQEQSIRYITNFFTFISGFNSSLRFTEVSATANPFYGHNLNDLAGNGVFNLRDSTIRNLVWFISDDKDHYYHLSVGATNNAFERCTIELDQFCVEPFALTLRLRNNLFFGGQVSIRHCGSALGEMEIYDNLFDTGTNTTSLSFYEDDSLPPTYGGNLMTVGFNAYTTTNAVFGGSSNKTNISTVYESGPLGRFYYPASGTTSSLTNLFDTGSATNAGEAGLFHYSTTTNSTEWSSRVDIGFHYPATSGDGKLLDSDGDGIPNYVEDANNNGLIDGNESSFVEIDTDFDGVSDAEEIAIETNPADASSVEMRRLGTWQFRTSDFTADTGQPVWFEDHVSRDTNAFSIYAAGMLATNSALQYRETQTSGTANISRGIGSVDLWFKPDWSTSTNLDVFSASNPGQLICMGQPSVAKDNWWSLHFSPKGDALIWETQAGGVARTNATVSINWTIGNWYLVHLSYTRTGVSVYTNGVLAVTNSLPTLVPASGYRLNERLCFGSFVGGGGSAKGSIDEIHTLNYLPNLTEIEQEYPGPLVRDDPDHDNVPTLVEIAQGLNPYNRDTDGDGMPDGWEVNAINMAPSFAGTALNPHTNDATGDPDGDGISNLREFWLGTNPYVANAEPSTLKAHKPQAQADLINLDFGTGASYTGIAAAGYNTNDYWNKVGPGFAGIAYPATAGTNASVGVYLRQTLGHVYKNLLPCPMNYTIFITNETNPFCVGMKRTNAFGNVECCVPISSVPPYLLYDHFDPLLQLSASLRRGWHRQYWYSTAFDAQVYILPPDNPTNLCITSSGFLNYAAVLNLRNRLLFDGGSSKLQFPLGDRSALYRTIWGADYSEVTSGPITNVQRLTMIDAYPEGYSKRTLDEVALADHPLVVNAALGWTTGFNVASSFVPTAGLLGNPMLADYLISSFDYDWSSLPQSTDCNSYRFLRDGHAQILIVDAHGYYRLYVYASSADDDEPLSINVNNQALVQTKVVRTSQTKWNLNAYSGATVLDNDGIITLDFPTNRSVINGIQLMKLSKLQVPTLSVETNEVYGAMVRISAIETATSFLIRRTNRGTGEVEEFRTFSSIFTDSDVPRDVAVAYSVRAENEVPELASDWSPDTSVSALPPIEFVNHAPTMKGEVYLNGAYKDTPFNLGAAMIASRCDAFDKDGDPLKFCVTELENGTLKLHKADGTITTITTNDLSDLNLNTAGTDTAFIWEPPAGRSEQWVQAFSVRAYDGMYLSQTAVPVWIYVKGPTILMWWGLANEIYNGNGQPHTVTDPTTGRFIDPSLWPKPSWTIDPTPVLSESTNSTTQLLTNIVQLAGGFDFRAALRADGTVWTWGRDLWGQLGDGISFLPSGGNSSFPVWYKFDAIRASKVTNLENVVSIATSGSHVLAAKSDGTVWGWGIAENGQLGEATVGLSTLGSYDTNFFIIYGITSIPTTSTPVQIPGLHDVVSVFAKGNMSSAITSDGQLYWWGEIDDDHKSKVPRLLEIPGRVSQVEWSLGRSVVQSDPYNFLVLNSDGDVYVGGANGEGQLGLGYQSSFIETPTRLPIGPAAAISGAGYYSAGGLILLKNGQVLQWGDGQATPKRVDGLSNIRKISRDQQGSYFAMDNAGRTFAWGKNFYGILGREWRASQDNALHEGIDNFAIPFLMDSVGTLEEAAAFDYNAFGAMRVDKLAPRGLQTLSRSNLVQVSWRTFSGASSYEVQRALDSTSESAFQTITIVPHNAALSRQIYDDRAVTNGFTYFYRVRALSQSEFSFFTDPVDGVPVDPPGEVATIYATPLSRQIKVSWSRALPANNYEVLRSENGGSFEPFQFVFDGGMGFGAFASDTDHVTVVDYSAVGTNLYSYKVRATNSAGFGSMSQSSSNVAILTQTLTPPSNLTLTITGNGVADLSWQMSDPSWVGTFWVRAFELNGTNLIRTIEPLKITQGTNTTIPHLNPGRTNLFQVSAVDELYGESSLVSTQKAWWPAYTVTTPIEFVTAKGGSGYIYLKWKGAAINYGVMITPSSGVECLYKIVNPDADGFAEYFAADLPATNYVIGIEQFYDEYGGAYATTTNISVSTGTFTNLPALKIIPGDNRMRITWWGDDSEYATNSTMFKDWRFVLQRKEDAEPAPTCPGYWTIYDTGDPFYGSKFTMGVLDEEVVNGHSYHFRLYGISPDHDVVLQTVTNLFTPFETFPKSNVLSVMVTNYSGGVGLSWNSLTNADGYRIDSAPNAGGPYVPIGHVSANSPNFEHRGLINGVPIFYVVTATNINGDTFSSSEVSALPSENGNLMKPSDFTVDLHGGHVFIFWNSVAGADSYSVWQTNLLQTLALPQFAVAYSGSVSQYRYDVKAHRRGAASTQPITAETIKWTPGTNVLRYQISIVENGSTNVVGERTTPDFEYVRLGTFTNLGSYIIAAYDANGPFWTNSTVQGRGGFTIPTVSTNEAAISLLDLGDSSTNALRIASPTNFILKVLVLNKDLGTNDIAGVEFFDGGLLIGVSRTPPYQFEWVNPPGSITGAVHTVEAHLVARDGRYMTNAAPGYLNVSTRPDLSAFTTTATDVQIPAPGLNLALTRHYDSRDASSSGILGKGWKFDWERTRITMADPSPGWSFQRDKITSQLYASEAQIHPIHVEINGAVDTFRPIAIGPALHDQSDFEDFNFYYFFNLAFAPVGSTSGRLTELPSGLRVALPTEDAGRSQNLSIDTEGGNLLPYRPSQFLYSTLDGTQFLFTNLTNVGGSQEFQMPLSAITDRFGNSITLTTNLANSRFFQHSNGRGLMLTNTNSFWVVYDPAELAVSTGSRVPVVKYKVENSLLTEVHQIKDRPSQTYDITYYSYDSSNRLASITGPDGAIQLANQYDTNHFVTKQTDAIGLESTLGFTSINGSVQLQVSQNVAGATNLAIFGAGGAISSVQSDVSDTNTVSQVGYRADGLPAFESRADGAYTSYEYDAAQRPTGVVDANGNRTSTQYADFGPSFTADANGNGTSYDYYLFSEASSTNVNVEVNPVGALREVTDSSGLRTTYTYNFRGQILIETKTSPTQGIPLITKYEYFNNGDLSRTSQLAAMSGTNQIFVTTDYTYDANGNRLTETRSRHILARDGSGAAILDGNSKPTLATESIVNGFVYDARNRLITSTNALSEISGSHYASNGKVDQSTNTFGQITTYLYDVRANLIETKHPDNTVSRTVFDERGRPVWNQERALADTNNVTIAPASETQYDSRGRVHLVFRHENTTIQRLTLASTNDSASFTPGQFYRKLSTVTNAPTQYTISVTSTGAVASITRTDYDSLGRVKYTVNALGGVTANGYDLVGRQTSVTNYPGYALANIASDTVAPPTNNFTTMQFGFDANGNQVFVIDGNTNRTDFYYDKLNRRWLTQFPAVSGERNVQWTQFDGFGRKIAENDEVGTKTAFEYDLLGRLVTVTNDMKPVYTTLDVPIVTRYAYDELGNLTNEVRTVYSGAFEEVAEQRRVTWFEYDKIGRRTYRFLPSLPASLDDNSGNAVMEKTVYSKVGSGPYTLRKTVRDFRGIIITNDFDAMDRLVTKALPAVNSGEVLRTVSYDYTGSLLSMVRENGTGIARTNYYHYDDSRRLRRKDTPEGVLAYTYAPNNAVTTIRGFARSVILPVNSEVSTQTPSSNIGYNYDALGRLSTVTNYSVSSGVTTYSYDGVGNLAVTAYPANRITNTFDARNRLTSIRIGQTNGTLLRKFDYGYAVTSLRTNVTESHLSGTNTVQRRRVAYRYDEGVEDLNQMTHTPARVNRLTHEDMIEGTGSDPNAGENFLYDPLGNRQIQNAFNVSGVSGGNFEYNILDQFDSGYGYGFDANGNTTNSPGSTTDYYDTENRLVKRVQGTTTITMGYDAEGNRVWRHVNANGIHTTIYFLIDDKNPTGYPQIMTQFKDTASSPAPVTATFNGVYEWGLKLISFKQGGTNYWVGADGLGSVRFVLLSSGSALIGHDYDYDGYGNLISNPGTAIDLPVRYANYEWDSPLGMAHTGPRYYDTQSGRFWQRDSNVGDRDNPITLNLYSYCAADPINRIDLSGNEYIDLSGVLVDLPRAVYTQRYRTTFIAKGGMSQVQKWEIDVALAEARNYARWAANAVKDFTERHVSRKYTRWFGSPGNGERVVKVRDTYNRIYAALTGPPLTFEANVPGYFSRSTEYYGYTHPLFKAIRLGDLFWSAPLTGMDSRAGTIIHELSHVVSDTHDHEYEIPDCLDLALHKPDKAIDNANNVEYFVEE